jgi:proton-translocating NAD(P)+ transhydrogenase subunit alpha
MRIAVARETAPDEARVALVPEVVQKLTKAGHQISVQTGAGLAAGSSDADYEKAGARVVGSRARALAEAELWTRVRRPTAVELQEAAEGSVVVSMLGVEPPEALLPALSARRLTLLGLERVPRITRAQGMDVLSSQATVAGYKAVLLGAVELGKLLPMLTTAAGTLAPARTLVLGAGVAGLQAIATARRLGAVVSGFDVRPAAREQVLSLGATFVGPELVSESAEAEGGYARAQTADEEARTRAALAEVLPKQDLIICTAQVPGHRAPVLVDAGALATLRPGSVVVDLAAETGGNVEGTRAGERVVVHGVVVLGPVQLAATVPLHASQMYARNVLALIQHLATKEGALRIDPEDEITRALLVSLEGRTPGGNGQ